MDTPYQWTKQVASHWGGTRNGTIVHWPNGIQAKGEMRTQFHHVIDIATTVLEAAGIPEPVIVNSVQQMPLQGTSMVYSFDDAQAAERHEIQYFEMFVNRGIYHKGWTAVTRHSTPWDVTAQLHPYDEDVWELYAPDDWSQAHDLSKEMPDKLRELTAAVPDRGGQVQRLPAGRPPHRTVQLGPGGTPGAGQRQPQILFRGMGRLTENTVVNIKNKSHAVTAQVVVPDGGDGATASSSPRAARLAAGRSMRKRASPRTATTCSACSGSRSTGDTAIPSGEHQVRMEFAYDGGGLAKGGNVRSTLTGTRLAKGA